jgi:hypothetical protein
VRPLNQRRRASVSISKSCLLSWSRIATSSSAARDRLAENADVSVLLLEAGGSDDDASVKDASAWVYLQARMEPAAECMLVLIGATPEGKKELVGFQTGVRESAQSWRELLIDIKHRGLEIAPDLAVGDGALGFWKAIEAREVTGERIAEKSGSQETPRRREVDSNFRFRTRGAMAWPSSVASWAFFSARNCSALRARSSLTPLPVAPGPGRTEC